MTSGLRRIRKHNNKRFLCVTCTDQLLERPNLCWLQFEMQAIRQQIAHSTRLARSFRSINGHVIRPRRSVLYVSGANENAIQQALIVPADSVVLDLEDTVASERKGKARQRVCELIETKAFGKREVVVRVNGFHTPWFDDDLSAVLDVAPNAILLSKVTSPETLRAVEQLISANMNSSVYTHLWTMIETPLAVLNAAQIAASTTRLECMVMGTRDLLRGLHAPVLRNRTNLLYALSSVVLAARAHGLAVVDGVYRDVQDDTLFRAQCTQALQLGFDGKALVLPRHVRCVVINSFAPL